MTPPHLTIPTCAPNPAPGTWELAIEHGREVSAEVSVSTYAKGWFQRLLKRGPGWFACKTCKLALRTLVVATLIHIGPLVAAGGLAAQGVPAVLAALKPIVLEILTQTFTLSAGGVPQFLSICLQYTGKPVDTVMQAICKWLRLCPATAAA